MPENTHNKTIIAQVKRRDNQFTQAAVKVDAATLKSIMSDDYIFIGGEGQKMNKNRHITSLKSGDRKYRSLKSSGVKVRPYGNLAVLTGHVTAEGSLKGQEIRGGYLVTRVYVKQGDSWMIVSAQATASAS